MKSRGLTLIELLITLSISAILMSLAVPNFRSFLVKQSMSTGLDAMAADFRLARAEALRRGTTVTICRSTNGLACAESGSWSRGWIVFIDFDADGAVDLDDEVVKVQSSLTGITSVLGWGDADPRTGVTFEAAGWAKAASQDFVFTPSGSLSSVGTRVLCISNSGRAAVKAKEVGSCS